MTDPNEPKGTVEDGLTEAIIVGDCPDVLI